MATKRKGSGSEGGRKEKDKVRLTFIHPDLGLGGAERLIVDAATGLQQRGYDVRIYTGYHDKGRAFPETTDGTLQVVRVASWIPRSICGRFVALMAYIKMIVIAMYISITTFCSRTTLDVVVCDQVSACIPFFKLIPFARKPKILFYCHFPDQLLAKRPSRIIALYRKPLDYMEEVTTGMADKITVNSNFTKGVFKDTFTSLRVVPEVLYPSINAKLFDDLLKSKQNVKLDIPTLKHVFLSISRFEPKKNIELAIRTLKKLRTCLDETDWNNVHLVLAGGYDPRLQYCVEYLEFLKKIVAEEGVADHVSFHLSPKDPVKVQLLSICSALIYTPSEEHFGIVPLEAMYLGKPVIAVNSGGPRETVVDGETGFLCPATEQHFATAMGRIVVEPKLAKQMGGAGKQRFMEKFSFEIFTDNWDRCITGCLPLTFQKES